jgi:integrase
MLSLGQYPDVTLSEARERHIDARRQLAAGTNPAEQRRALVAEAVGAVLLGDYAQPTYGAYADEHQLAAGTRAAYVRALDYYVDAIRADTQVKAITSADVHAATKVVLERGHETAKKGLQALRHVFAHAMATALVPFDPASAVKLPKPKHAKQRRKGVTTQDGLRDVMRAIAGNGLPRAQVIALRMLAMTMPRPSELLEAAWTEVDLDAGQWVIPAERTKMRKEHLVPLPAQAVTLLRELRELIPGDRLFTGLTDAALRQSLSKIGIADVQHLHGFRVTGATVLAEMGHDESVIELCLAHAVPGVKGIYNRAHKLPQRKELLQAWADHLDTLAA